MVEINFMEMYSQPAKSIFEVTIFHCKKYFKRVKEQWAIFILAHFIWAVA